MSEPDAFEFHVICQTHWDREWRLSFQQTRVMLVDMMDHLISLLESDPAYRHYHLDGQTILLEDYLEIRPENRNRLAAMIADGRILVGPWYTLPEENLIDGECLVRNLLMGHALASELGGVMKVGFTPTSYGQVSQMPQIYMGFGIDSILFHRGVPSHEVDLEYAWEGSDGTTILGIRPPMGGRFNFSTMVTVPLLNPENGRESPYSAAPARMLSRSLSLKDESGRTSDGMYYSEAVSSQWPQGKLQSALQALRDSATGKATTALILCGEGNDLMEPNPVLPRLVAAANASAGNDRFLIGSLPSFIAKLKKSVNGLKVLKGELRSTQRDESGARLYAGTLSSRMYLKQMNRRAEGLLLKWAEPFSTLSWTLGEAYPSAMLRQAWKYLLANHAHDSISGTGTDQVHEDMVCRFRQCEQIGLELTRKALTRIAARVEVDGADDGAPLITVFNPLPFGRDEVVQIDLDLPESSLPLIRVWEAEGRQVTCHVNNRTDRIHTLQQTHGFPYRFYATQHRLCFLAEAVPAMGYKTYRVETLPETTGKPADSSCRHPAVATDGGHEDTVQVTGETQLENRHLRVNINADGTLNVLDKATGRSYDRLNAFVDDGEIGDSYERARPTTDTVVTSIRQKATISVVENNPFAAFCEVKLVLSLPQAVAPDKSKRSDSRRQFEIISTVTLKMNSRAVEITTRLDNNVKDHRLRVLFPSRIRTDECWAHGQFDLVRRPVLRPDDGGWIEPPCPTQPQLNFVDLTSGKEGLAIINRGLPEYEVLDDADRTIALTLLRCFTHKTRSTQVDDPAQTGTQCPGKHEFHYAIYPHAGNAIEGDVFAEAQRINHPLKIVQGWKCASGDSTDGRLPAQFSGLSIAPRELILSSLKQSEDGQRLVLRFFNPSDLEVEARIRVHRHIAQADWLDLEENVLHPCPVQDGQTVVVTTGAKKIVTLGLTLR